MADLVRDICGTNSPMRRLKEWAHRRPLLAGFAEALHARRRARGFEAHLDCALGEAVRWSTSAAVLECARAQVRALEAIPAPPPRKGSPCKVSLRMKDLHVLQEALAPRNARPGSRELAAAMRIASVDPAELAGFKLWLAMFWLHHEPIVHKLRAALRRRVVLHMSCMPRLSRAELSIASFAHATQLAVEHLKLVGNGTHYEFDEAAMLLASPSPDTYECLPQKVFYGLAIVTLAANPSCVLKLDDDHRLKSARELARLLEFAAGTRHAIQIGEINRAPLPSAHHRAWHFGKCAQSALNERLLEMPVPSRWAAGSSGYILNRPALWRLVWASLYYRRWLDEILYEDVALAEVAEKTGIRLVQAPMSRAVSAVTEY